MIIMPIEKLVIATPTGVDAIALHNELCCRNGVIWFCEQDQTGGVNEYGIKVANQWKTYQRAVLARNPYTRILSMLDDVNEMRLAQNKRPITLGEYVDKLPLLEISTVSAWAETLKPYRIIHYESIGKDIRKITGLRMRCPTEENKLWRKQFEKLKPERLSYLYEYLIRDLVEFGYISKAITPIEAKALRGSE